MSGKGNCLDNAVVESFFGVLNREMLIGKEFKYKNYMELKTAIDGYIEIERNIAHKYNIEESIFRMKKRACNYGPIISKETKWSKY